MSGSWRARPSREASILALAVISSFLVAGVARGGSPPLERGVALGLFSADPDYGYRALVDEIAGTGATHLSVAWVSWQEDVEATHPGLRSSATNAQILETLRHAESVGLHVTAFPILGLERAGEKEWRGVLRPKDESAWWESYEDVILGAADLAERGGAHRLSVGSELLSREPMRARWRELIERVRAKAPGLEILYSANWDHYEPVSFWDLVDVVGVTGYFELTRDSGASVSDLLASWSAIKPVVLEWSRRIGRKVVLTEVGYPSADQGVAWPWDHTLRTPVDLEEQRRGYEAFVRAWSDTPQIQGVYFWNWFGFGGPKDAGYTPRGKPAEAVVRAWYREARAPR